MTYSDLLSLDDIGQNHGTDKARGSHNYLVWYETFFAPMRDKPIIFFEMGVGNGASLRTWRDYFPKALVIGMDIGEDRIKEAGDRISVVIGDQSNDDDLDRACPGGVSIINDDAGHQPEHQLFAFKRLLPRIADGGLYVLEDIGSRDVTDFFTRLARHAVHASWSEDSDEWVKLHGPLIESVNFYRESIVTRLKWHA